MSWGLLKELCGQLDNTGTFCIASLLIFSPPLILQGTLQVMLYEGTVGIIP